MVYRALSESSGDKDSTLFIGQPMPQQPQPTEGTEGHFELDPGDGRFQGNFQTNEPGGNLVLLSLGGWLALVIVVALLRSKRGHDGGSKAA